MFSKDRKATYGRLMSGASLLPVAKKETGRSAPPAFVARRCEAGILRMHAVQQSRAVAERVDAGAGDLKHAAVEIGQRRVF